MQGVDNVTVKTQYTIGNAMCGYVQNAEMMTIQYSTYCILPILDSTCYLIQYTKDILLDNTLNFK